MPKQEPKFFTEKQLESQRVFLRYRWEFMRRDPEYIEAYQKALKLRDKTPNPPQIECVRVSLKNSLYHETKEHEEEIRLSAKYFQLLSLMLNPNRTFDELINYLAENMNYYGGNDALKLHINTAYDELEKALLGYPVKCFPIYKDSCNLFKDDDFKAGKLFFEIDLNKINSFNSLMEVVESLIGSQYYLRIYNGKKDKSVKKTVKSKEVDYNNILMIGDLYFKKEMTYERIAMKLFPNEFDSNKKTAKPESRIRRMGQICDKYKNLVNGGWRELQYP